MVINFMILIILNVFIKYFRYDSSYETGGVITATRNVKVTYKTEPSAMQSRTFTSSPLQSHITSTTRSYHSNGESQVNAPVQLTKHNESAEGFDDGPSFKEALRAFQGSSNSSGVSSTNTSFNKVNSRSFNESKQILTSTTQQIERTMHTTSSNKSYHVEQS